MSSDDVTITEVGSALFVARGRGVREYTLDPAEVAALREYFAAERMPEDVQKLVESVRERVDDVMQGNQTGRSDSIFNLAIQLTDALEAAYSKGADRDPR